MIIIFFGWGNILLLLSAVMLLGSIAFSIWYAINEAKEEGEKWWEKELSTPKRIGIAGNVVAVFLSVLTVAYGWVNHSAVGVVGILIWIISSLILAYTASPLRLHAYDGENHGCATILFMPLLMILSLVSLLLIMFTSWVFALVTLLKGLSKKVYIIIGVSILVLVAVAVGIGFAQKNQEAKVEQQKAELNTQIIEKLRESIEEGKLEPIPYTEEELAIIEQVEIKPFATIDAKGMIAEKFSELYRKKDFNGIVDFAVYLDYHHATHFIGEDTTADIAFDADFIAFLSQQIREKGEPQSSDWYLIDGRKFCLGGKFVYFETLIEDGVGTVILGTEHYRNEHYKDYDDDPVGLCLIIGEEVTDKEYESNKEPDYYPAAMCPKCYTHFRADTTGARMIAKHGYCGLYLCGKD